MTSVPVVFDSSALLAIAFGEAGAAYAQAALSEGILSTVNASEVVACFVDRGATQVQARQWLRGFGIAIRPFDEDLAVATGLLRDLTRKAGLSLGNRACIALAQRENGSVITADRSWAALELGVEVTLIR